ncbi:MAG: ABC transporter substrate-binding protein [Pseudomonadota bacterium]
MAFIKPSFILLLIFICSPLYAEEKGPSLRADPAGFVLDQAGRRIDVRHPFKRVISLYGAHTENLFSLGLDKEIIGVGRNEVYPPEALNKPVFSYHDDPEKFLAVRPDLVLIRPMIDRGYARLVQRLEKNGVHVASLQPGTVDDMFVYWEILGMLTGRRDKALQMIAGFRGEVEEIRSLTAPIFPKKRVYFEAIHNRMKTFSPDAMAVFALECAGGVNTAGDAKPVRGTNIAYYGKERILSHAGEIDAFIAQKGAMNRPTVDLIKNEPGFSAIKAVREGRILIIDEMIVSRPTLRLTQGIRRIGNFLYPAVVTLNDER